MDGISRNLNGFYRETSGSNANVTRFDNTVWGGGVGFGIPVSEFNDLNTSFIYENTEISNDGFFAQEVLDFIAQNGRKYDILKAGAGFSYDTRNKAILPDKGTAHRINAQIALPFFGNSLEFYKLSYKAVWYTSLLEDYILSFKGKLGYGDGYGDTNELPFFENFYAGGPRSVRGFEENTLGPKDSFGNPLGGNVELTGGAEVILPVPFFKDVKSIRIAGFLDVGNVYNDEIDLGRLRYSAGVSGFWVSPFGIVSVSIAQPFNDEPGDDLQAFQFTFGSSF